MGVINPLTNSDTPAEIRAFPPLPQFLTDYGCRVGALLNDGSVP